MARRLLPLMVAMLVILPFVTQIASAGSYTYSGTAEVDAKYRYVGFTPEKIYLKTNVLWSNSVLSGAYGTGIIMYKKLTISLWSYSQITGKWYKYAEKTYTNTFNNLGGIVSKEFTVISYGYYKNWWDAFTGKTYVMYEITIPKDKALYHQNSGDTIILVSLQGDGALYKWGSGTFEQVYLLVSGSSSYYVNPTPYDMYKKYWGYTASVDDYNNLNQTPAGGEVLNTQFAQFDKVDLILATLFIFAVATLIVVYVSGDRHL